MRVVSIRCMFAIALVALAGSLSAAEPEEVSSPEAPAVVRGTPILTPKAVWRWSTRTAPRLAPRIGALAISGLDTAAGRTPAPLRVVGEGTPPLRWPFDSGGDLRVIPSAPESVRIAAAFGTTTFTLADKDQGYEMLELRLRYEDGVAVWINGTEVARQALPRDDAMALALRPHGPEWETLYIPVAPGLLRLGDNTLAIEVHPAGRHHAPTLQAELAGRRDRGILRGPVLAEVGATTARIAVETDPNTDCVLAWGTGATLDQRLTSAPGRHHMFNLTALPATATVRYRVHAGATQSAIYAFHTMPAAGTTIRIGVYGDVRGGHAIHRKLVDHMLGEPLDLVAVTGDMVLHGSDDADWQRFFAITQPLLGRVPYYPTVGNHDLGWDGADATRDASDIFALPAGPPDRPGGVYWYSYDLADLHLVFLDSNAYDRGEQETWLEADLAAARARKVRGIVAFAHDGPFSRGYHRGNPVARTRYVPILAKHHVDLVLAGHDHLYQRGEQDGIRYIVTGGGGASLYAVSCDAPGKPKCRVDDGMKSIFREHHFLVLTVGKTSLEACARKTDGRLLEPCTRYPLWRP